MLHSLLSFIGICGKLSCTEMHHIFYKLQCYDDFLNHNLLRGVVLILIKRTDNTIEPLSLFYFCIRFRCVLFLLLFPFPLSLARSLAQCTQRTVTNRNVFDGEIRTKLTNDKTIDSVACILSRIK